MLKNRVYVESASDAPGDAIIREGKRGRLYYDTTERGNNSHVGGNKDNDLLESDLDKNMTSKVYIDGADEAPSGVTIERDDNGLFYRASPYEVVSEEYPEDLEDEMDVEMPDAEDADGPD